MRTYNIPNTATWLSSDASIDEKGECFRCGGKELPVLCIQQDYDELCLCQPCLTAAFEEAGGYFAAFPEKP